MALSNLLNEPRREITEQIVGTALVALYIGGDLGLVWLMEPKNTSDYVIGIILMAIMTPIVTMFVYIMAMAIHGLGDLACGWLGKIGFDPRPTQRYRQ